MLNCELSAMRSKKTKIIATIGPASESEAVITDMMRNGLNVVRINASHNADREYITKIVQKVRACADQVQLPIGIFLDLQGPKIRIGKFAEGPVSLENGQTFVLTADDVLGNIERVGLTYKGLVHDTAPGESIFINDGAIKLLVKDVVGNDIICEVIQGGVLSNSKGVNLPTTRLSLSPITEKDREDALVAIDCKLDYLAMSFVSDAETVRSFRKYLDDNGGHEVKIIAKIERQVAIDNISEIVDEVDAVMVARGDLGVEIGLEKVPEAQKNIIYECNRRTKPVIVATQMLETMIEKRNATRAEVSDVANAIYDRCDAVMLSGETAVGIDPAHVIKTMTDICIAADTTMSLKKEGGYAAIKPVQQTLSGSFAAAADLIATETNAKALIIFTTTGKSPLRSSKLNPKIQILAVTDNEQAYTRMTLLRAVIPIRIDKKFTEFSRWSEMITDAIQAAKELSFLRSGDKIVLLAGIPVVNSGSTNSVRYLQIK